MRWTSFPTRSSLSTRRGKQMRSTKHVVSVSQRWHCRYERRSRNYRLPDPGNDDAIRAIRVMLQKLVDAIVSASGEARIREEVGDGGRVRLNDGSSRSSESEASNAPVFSNAQKPLTPILLMEINPQLVKQLREKTNAGMMDCKRAPDRGGWRSGEGGSDSCAKRNREREQESHRARPRKASSRLHSSAGQSWRARGSKLRNRFCSEERRLSALLLKTSRCILPPRSRFM